MLVTNASKFVTILSFMVLASNMAIAQISFSTLKEHDENNHHGLQKSDTTKLAGAGATIVDPSFFPATHIAHAPGVGGQCTATLVGPRAVLIAAHCVENGGTIQLAGLSGVCNHSPDYNPQTQFGRTADYALCLLDKTTIGLRYESVKTDFNGINQLNFLMLSGAGCTTKNPPTYDNTFRVGFARIIGVPNSFSNDIVTSWEAVHSAGGQGAALCSGDSGGPAFYLENLLDITERKIAAVNSRSAMRCIHGPDNVNGGCIGGFAIIDGFSYLSSLATPTALAFMQNWTNSTGVGICGFNLESQICR